MKARAMVLAGMVAAVVATGWRWEGARAWGEGVATTRPASKSPLRLPTNAQWVKMTPQQRRAYSRERARQMHAHLEALIAEHDKEMRAALVAKRLHGHREGVWAAAFSPDGKLVATGSADRTVRLWDVATGKELKKLEGHTRGVLTVGFSSDGKHLVSGGMDQQIIAWNVGTGEVEGIWKQECPVWKAAFLAGGTSIVSSCGEHLRMWKIGEDAQVRVMDAGGNILALAATEDGGVVTGNRTGTVTLWDTSTGEALLTRTRAAGRYEKRNGIWCVRTLKNGDVLVADEDAVWRWNLTTGEMKKVKDRTFRAVFAANSEKDLIGTTWAGMEVDGVGEKVFWNWSMREPGGAAAIHGLAMSPSGEYLVVTAGGWYDQHLNLMGSGPKDVEIYSVEALLKMARAHPEPEPGLEERLSMDRNTGGIATIPTAEGGSVSVPPAAGEKDWK